MDQYWGHIYQNMCLLCTLATNDVKYSKNCAIWCFLSITGLKYGTNIYFVYILTTNDVKYSKYCVIWCFWTIIGVKYIKIYTSFKHIEHSWCKNCAIWCFRTITGAKCTKLCTSFKHTEHSWCQIQQKLCHLMLFHHNWAQMCQNMYLFMHGNHKWFQIKQILCYLMRLDHNWCQIYQNMLFMQSGYRYVNTATNSAIWCFWSITGLKCVKICTFLCTLTTNDVK